VTSKQSMIDKALIYEIVPVVLVVLIAIAFTFYGGNYFVSAHSNRRLIERLDERVRALEVRQ
jgi:hypothetical protein